MKTLRYACSLFLLLACHGVAAAQANQQGNEAVENLLAFIAVAVVLGGTCIVFAGVWCALEWLANHWSRKLAVIPTGIVLVLMALFPPWVCTRTSTQRYVRTPPRVNAGYALLTSTPAPPDSIDERYYSVVIDTTRLAVQCFAVFVTGAVVWFVSPAVPKAQRVKPAPAPTPDPPEAVTPSAQPTP